MTAFVTGYQGFLGSALVDRLVADAPGEVDVTRLDQPKYRSVAEDRTESLEDTAVTCPPLHAYLDTLVEFVRANPDAAGGPMA